MLNIRADRLSGGTAVAMAESPGAKGRVTPSLAIEGVTKRFGEIVALHEARLAIARGELVTLLGPSGCGKTTLLNLIAGFLEPDAGEIFIDGAAVTNVPTFRREIGMVFQNYALFPHMSVARNIGYGLTMRGLPRAEMASRVAEVLALVKLEGFADRRPRQLSGGQQQRVALARALVIQPKVLLLDEPFSALDKNLRASMQVELKEIQRKLGVTTVFVTHDQSEALSMSDRIAVISEGCIRQIGTPDDIYRHPRDRFVARFVGDVNVLAGRLERIEGAQAIVAVGAVRVAVPADTLDGVAAGAAVDVFVRPEHVRIAADGETAAFTDPVAAQVYQGDHVDIYVESPAAASGRLIMRLPGRGAMANCPVGGRVGVAIDEDDLVAFAHEAGS